MRALVLIPDNLNGSATLAVVVIVVCVISPILLGLTWRLRDRQTRQRNADADDAGQR